MPHHENPQFTAIVHQTVATSKELAEFLQNEIAAHPTDVTIEIGGGTVQAIATQLRITANLVAGLLEENASMMDRISELVDRVHKQD